MPEKIRRGATIVEPREDKRKSQEPLTLHSASGITLVAWTSRAGSGIPVYGLGCGGAGTRTIERELAATDGVLNAYVNPATETAYIDYDPGETDSWVLARAIERAGYRSGPIEA